MRLALQLTGNGTSIVFKTQNFLWEHMGKTIGPQAMLSALSKLPCGMLAVAAAMSQVLDKQGQPFGHILRVEVFDFVERLLHAYPVPTASASTKADQDAEATQ